jgi:NADH-quinone oxidoreductase subunit F
MKDNGIRQEITISACAGTGGMAAGGLEVLETFKQIIEQKGIKGLFEPRTHKVGCRGFCAKDVLVDITIDKETYTYQFVTPEMVPVIVEQHIIGGQPVDQWLVGEDYSQFHDFQQKLILAQCGHIDPESIEDYQRIGGYDALRKALEKSPEEIIQIVKASRLRGRGGAGFPTGIKWESCRESPGEVKVVICNADEGDPGAFMDRSIIEGNPHAVIEGMSIGAYAIGAAEGYVYIRSEYPLAVERLHLALDQARETGALGENILGQGFNFDIKVFLGAGAFVCGEETALMASIEDKPGEPKLKYVFPTEKGLWENPTTINNVETWANIPAIVDKGADWYAGIGSETSKGTKIFSLVGKINNTGLVEVPMGTPLRKIVYDIGGGIPDKKKLKAVQTGGPSGGCIPADLINIPVDFENIAKVGSIMGSGGMVVMDEVYAVPRGRSNPA